MNNKFGKIKSYVETLDLNEVEKKGQSLILTSNDIYGSVGSNGFLCKNHSGCDATNRVGCSNGENCH